jgi:hypothetical protein
MNTFIRLDMLLESFMEAATRWAITPRGRSGYVQGVEWGHAFGIYNTLDFMGIPGIADKEIVAELRAVLFGKEAKS